MDARFTTPALARLFAPEAQVARMLAFEAALARALASCRVIPAAAADAIAEACRPEDFDAPALLRAAATEGTIAIPLVAALVERTSVAGRAYVHWGATSQDVVDTALVLQLRDALALVDADLVRVCGRCAALAREHRRTVMAGRTLLQQAVPITFGLKAARWLDLSVRQLRASRASQAAAIVLQFGGASGTLAALGHRGTDVARELARALDLPSPPLPWHAERDRMATLAASLAIVAGSLAKIAHDVLLLAQTEVGEAYEGRHAGSSAMPNKRNPVDATMAVAAARLARAQAGVVIEGLVQDHERAAGAWQAEWAAMADTCAYSGGVVARVADLLDALVVDTARMAANLAIDRGTIGAEALATALAHPLGRPAAQRLVRDLCERARREMRSLADTARLDARVTAVLDEAALERSLDAAQHLGSADELVDRALAAWEDISAERR